MGSDWIGSGLDRVRTGTGPDWNGVRTGRVRSGHVTSVRKSVYALLTEVA